jgi:hypothetical protein
MLRTRAYAMGLSRTLQRGPFGALMLLMLWLFPTLSSRAQDPAGQFWLGHGPFKLYSALEPTDPLLTSCEGGGGGGEGNVRFRGLSGPLLASI